MKRVKIIYDAYYEEIIIIIIIIIIIFKCKSKI